MTDLNEFQRKCVATKNWLKHRDVEYPVLAMAGEAGEAANVLKKMWRNEWDPKQNPYMENKNYIGVALASDEQRQKLVEEIMDTMWYAATALADLGLSLEGAADLLFRKLDARHPGRIK